MTFEYVILEQPAGSDAGYEPHGAAAEFWRCKDQEVVISGPAETGKTLVCLHKLDTMAWKYPGLQGAIVRRTYQSMPGSVLQTFDKKVLGAWDPHKKSFDQTLTPVRKYGGSKPEWYDYPNGSRLWVGGMDKPSKVLSSERDVIYVNQVEELELNEWETLTTRTTGRAGNMPYSQIIGDCNPSHPQHWLLARRDEGKLTFLESRHEDNPVLYDHTTGLWTEQGLRTLAVLDNLTGVRYLRLRKGIWAQAEGIVYDEYDPAVHDFTELGEYKRYIASVDWGYTNPGVIQVWGLDGDDRMYLVREIYHTRRTDDWWSERAKELDNEFGISMFVCDLSEPAYIEKFRRKRLNAIGGFNSVGPGINAVKERLKRADDGKPRLYFRLNALRQPDPWLKENHKPTQTRDELSLYIWNDKTMKDEPIKENDHGMDAMRYAVAYVDGLGEERKPPGILGQGKARGWNP